MHREQTIIFCFCDEFTPKIANRFVNLNNEFKIKHIKSKASFLQQIEQHNFFILVIDRTHFSYFIDKADDLNLNNTGKYLSIIVVDDSEKTDLKLPSGNLLFEFVQSIPLSISDKLFHQFLQNARQYLLNKQDLVKLQQLFDAQTKELRELNDIGIALSAERDPDKLLEMILKKSREITVADAGSLYLVEKIEDIEADESDYFKDKQLRFKLAQCDSIEVDFNESLMPIEKRSIAGQVALSGEILNIDDVYNLPKNSEFTHNRSFDESVGYRTTSMLVIPMKNHKDEIIGVLQLINKKKNWNARLSSKSKVEEDVVRFDKKCVDLASSLASQAAVSIENTRLYEEIKNLFEGFIKASVHAIEQRDPTTFGHSERVATLTTSLAATIDKIKLGRFRQVRFSRDDIQQINYAALLHDFGKIGVRENILVKAKKLFPYELDAIKTRFKIFSQATELNYSKEKLNYLLEEAREKALSKLQTIDQQTQDRLEQLDQYLKVIFEINEPTVMKSAGFEMLSKIANIVINENGKFEHLLTEREIERLSIPKGSLSQIEREEIESHVTHTFNFLNRIPWTKELSGIPQIAYAHHEKLDGSGYPRKLSDQEIPIQSKMMTIADIFDALTAWDRPYKKSVPIEKALDILQWEVDEGKVDGDLLNVFLEAKIYDLVKKPE